mgnify:CR=1 FL=1
MKFLFAFLNVISKILVIYQTALHIAIENDNIEIVQLLLTNPQIDVNIKASISNCLLLKFQILFFIQF